MLEIAVVLIFCGFLTACVILDLSVLYALAAGLVLFSVYAVFLGHSPRAVGKMILSGMKTTGGMLISFALIGILSALWRASGTIAVIVCWASDFITPGVFLVMTWLLCSLVSVLLGSSFGTSATMGIVCMMIGKTIGANVVLTGGAILGGIYFGDRCSPVSPSALLKAKLTGTDIYRNIPLMLRSNLVPYIISTLLYIAIGLTTSHSGTLPDIHAFFAQEFFLHWTAVIPAALILILAAFRMKSRWILIVSSAVSAALAFALQGLGPVEIGRIMLLGYSAKEPALSAVMNGGGLISMVKTSGILMLSAAEAGIFKGIGMFSGARSLMQRIRKRFTAFTAALLAGSVTSLISCAETPAMFLTMQICNLPDMDRSE